MSLRWLVLAPLALACHPSVYRCRAAATAELWEQATVVCAAAFDETGDPWTGLNLARAYLYRNDDARARAVAERPRHRANHSAIPPPSWRRRSPVAR